MIKNKPSIVKPVKTVPKRRSISNADSQNVRPSITFNTKGYFDPEQPFDEEYLKVKQKVFEKYRNKREEIVMLDIKNTNKAAFIQKGLLIPIKECNTSQNLENISALTERARNTLLKKYLIRKEKREQIDQQKYNDQPNKIHSELMAQTKNTITSRAIQSSRQLSSRISMNSVTKFDTEI